MKPGPERGAAAQPQPSISNGHGSGPAIANGRDHAGATEHASLATTDSGPQHSGSRGAGADGLSASEDLRPLPADSGRPSIDSAGRRRSRASRFTTEAEGDRRQVWSFSSSGWASPLVHGTRAVLRLHLVCAVRPAAHRLAAQPGQARRLQAAAAARRWLFCYCFGAVKALKQLGLEDVYTIGSSGGACAGSYLYHDADIDATIEYILKCAATARTSWRACLDIKTYVRGAIKAFATPDLGAPPLRGMDDGPGASMASHGSLGGLVGTNKVAACSFDQQPWQAGRQAGGPCTRQAHPACAAAKKLNGNYEVSVTRLPWLRNHRVRKFRGVADLTDAIVASSCIMPGWPVWLDECGAYCIDGGFSDLQILKVPACVARLRGCPAGRRSCVWADCRRLSEPRAPRTGRLLPGNMSGWHPAAERGGLAACQGWHASAAAALDYQLPGSHCVPQAMQ